LNKNIIVISVSVNVSIFRFVTIFFVNVLDY